MVNLPDPIRKIIRAFSELPSIGPRQATRLAFFLVGRGAQALRELGADIQSLGGVKVCSRCFFVHQNQAPLCDICENPNRRNDIILIVEKETDLISIEATNAFTGRYLIVGTIGKSGELDDVQKLRLQNLAAFVRKELSGMAEEIILGFNPTAAGDWNASLIAQELKPLAKKLTRLGRGLPTGGEIEFADEATLGSALERRS